MFNEGYSPFSCGVARAGGEIWTRGSFIHRLQLLVRCFDFDVGFNSLTLVLGLLRELLRGESIECGLGYSRSVHFLEPIVPSPFPGMDPYLEGLLWMTVHTQLAAEIARQLAPKLRPRYLALTTERFVYEDPESVAISTATVYPDVAVTATGIDASSGATGTATSPLTLETVMPATIPHVTVEIRDTAGRELVTAIEVLSPTNKRGDGYGEYQAKRRRILLSTAHLMEIDLLRSGQRVPMRDPLPPAQYFVFLSRAENRPMTQVWPVRLDEPLPSVPVPLLPGDADVMLELQPALSNIYDLLGYDLAVDYRKPPEVPLDPEFERWAAARLAAAGFAS